MTTTIFLVRHGEVAGNSGEIRTFAGMSDLELTPRGLQQAARVAQRLEIEKIDAVYASTLQRAWKTADGIAARHGLETRRDAAWCEVNYGAWEGLSEGDILARHGELWKQRVQNPWSVAPPGGESYEMLWKRLEPAWNGLAERHAGQSVVVVGHNGSLRVLLCHLLEAPMHNARRLHIGNCSITRVEAGDAKTVEGGALAGPPIVIEFVNNTCHLEGI